MSDPIKVAVAGAAGRMGKEVVKMVLEAPDLQLVAAVSVSKAGLDAGVVAGLPECGVALSDNLEQALAEHRPRVLVDFTTPASAFSNTELAIRLGVSPVVGTTGFTPEQIEELDKLCQARGIGGLIAPNFSIGAILMMKFAAQAAKYFPHLEIIEYHGDQKLDAPSGTAVKTAELIAQNRQELRQGNPHEEETIEGARGGYYNGFRIHSVRLPGVFAQQEVIFGGFGQTLKIRHDSYERAGYMPGVNLAIKKVLEYEGMVYGFDHFVE
ncbi:MAG: 4-hydroxy-tetrahydrodipicolinate reductase [Paenibacillus macerans]|uniref:4-hydroxy-tetrahydrodipicolinate reductase n=1 Tax=Paenibacillus macerans TaxID=44252 RepID=A0A6N8F024_PAEMA|nr:4-hydroxy-tetrahydrodipicolinate reductase [Paenibacillus macerans]MDU7474467.1 4-hydroxy-tetrahydrodipicolinate reductase [Paenibacillus macerans]MEC0141080.1 4-hydroxy-tetrahydrodipicolinate reductase [Paenibacillus macerans]MEC0333107.1 4-hydroxy-tetrahydrodipicolinate reductase [Paenibacillus macerans]MUG23941.1 4-hydroxy-tetrahydrodipicolinate reductase [Paenibacillus macerans]UMV46587.1 4-hydroxy-tetrahydrodipicolinate reductase [Paenibacillus macerans]